jgi:hypothetical protein
MTEMSPPLGLADEMSAHFPASAGSAFADAAALSPDLVETCRPGVVVVAQAARLVVDDLDSAPGSFGEGEDLVDLLLILHDGEAHAGMVEHIGHLLATASA